jgi:rfaE bifunctional protein nucleotidyltransferase chain/domain
MKKSLSLDALSELRPGLEGAVVATNGCFDIIHAGHVSLLAQAKEMGEILIVGVNSDESVRLLKGEDRPINTQDHRAMVLSAFEFVDFVCVFEEQTATNFLRASQPHTYVKGGDYTKESLNEYELAVLNAYNTEIFIVPQVENLSTTHIIKRAGGHAD